MSDPRGGNLTWDVRDRLDEPDDVAIAWRDGDAWVDVTIGEFHAEITGIAKGLTASGIAAGDRVLLLAGPRHEWTLADYAILWAGAVVVPAYEGASTEHLRHVIGDSGATAAIVETEAHADAVRTVAPGLPVWVIDSAGLTDLAAAGSGVSDADLAARADALGPDSPATIVYTSGTTTTPKGCLLTHGNLRAEVASVIEQLPEIYDTEDASTLLVLPLAHIFARVAQFGAIRAGVRLGHTRSVRAFADDLRTFAPTFILAVPRLLEQALNAASASAYADGRGRIFDQAVRTAIAYSRALDNGKRAMTLRARHKAMDAMVYSRIRESFGGNASWAVSGGAPLGERLAHFFRGIGMPVLEGYGLTETTAAVSLNTPEAMQIGTVGRPIPGTSVRVAADGELLVRGPQVFGGYWNDPEATAAVLDADGWLSTGDLGELNDDGFLQVIGRKKEVIVTASGKAVAPEALEDRLRGHDVIHQCLLVGDGKPWIGALITLAPDAEPDAQSRIKDAIDAVNAELAPAESIRVFCVLDEPWTVENGYLTESLKTKRFAVERDFHDQIEAMYVR